MAMLIFSLLVMTSWIMLHTVCGHVTPLFTLQKALFNDSTYSNVVRPALSNNETVRVEVKVLLQSLVDVNEQAQTITVNVKLLVSWTDFSLAWKPDQYDNIESFLVTQESIWLPDIFVENSVIPMGHLGYDKMPVRLYHTGNVKWAPFVLLETSCDIVVTYFPMDTQLCSIEVETAVTFQDEVKIELHRSDPISTEQYHEDGRWVLRNCSAHDVIQPTAHKSTGKSSVQFDLVLERRSTFYVINILMPVLFLSLGPPAVFVLPCEAGEKITISTTVLLAYTVYLSAVSSYLPDTSVNVCILSIYLTSLLGLTTLSVIIASFILWLHHKPEGQSVGSKMAAVTCWAKTVTCSHLKTCRSRIKIDSFSDDENESKSDSKLGIPDFCCDLLTWRDVAKALDWFCFLLFSFLTLTLTVGTLTVLTLGTHRAAFEAALGTVSG